MLLLLTTPQSPAGNTQIRRALARLCPSLSPVLARRSATAATRPTEHSLRRNSLTPWFTPPCVLAPSTIVLPC